MPVRSAVPDYVIASVEALPPLPRAAHQLIALTRDADADFDAIAAVIETDQTLTARTLRAANSALLGASRQIGTVSQAIVRLGQETLMNMALSVSVMHMQQQMARAWPLDVDAFWRHNLAVATAARLLARHLRLPEADEAFVAGLLHDIGKLVMVQHFGVVYEQVLMAAHHGTEPLHHLERETFDVDHAVVGQALCHHWNIPASVTRAVAEHHDDDVLAPNSVAEVVRDANDLVKMAGLGESGNAYVELRPEQHLSLTRLRPDVLGTLIQELPREVERVYALTAPSDGAAAAVPPPPPGGDGAGPVVHVQVSLPEERRLVTLALLHLGLHPVVLEEGRPVPDAAAYPAALVTDLPMSDESDAAAARDVVVLDFARWRAEQGRRDGRHFHARALTRWLHAVLCGDR